MELRNKIAESGIITIDLETLFPNQEIMSLDIKQFLFKELILKEIDFRNALKSFDWSAFQDKIVAVFCSIDAIIPQWSYMLITQYLMNYTNKIYYGNIDDVSQTILFENINNLNTEELNDQRVVIKGCSNKKLPDAAYLEVSKKLIPHVKSLFFGEPCSTVPVYKKKK